MKSRLIKTRTETGFTLVEIAIVLLVVTILLGYAVAMFPVQQELKQYRQVDRTLDDIIAQLVGFAQVNGRLPCPDTSGDVNGTGVSGVLDGMEDFDDEFNNATGAGVGDGLPDSCKAFFGFLPAGTLGLNGGVDSGGRLLDPWGQPYLYHVSDINRNDTGGGADGNALTGVGVDLVSPDGIGEEGLANVVPNLVICDDSDNSSAADANCAAVGGQTIFASAAAVIVSTGKDRGQATAASNVQDENTDGIHNGTSDFVYTSRTRSDVAATLYDDRLRWISPNLLYSRMIESGQLP